MECETEAEGGGVTRGVVLSLCDITGNFVQPWVDAGYQAILVDPQHGVTHWDGPVLKVAGTVLEAMPLIRDYLPQVVFVAGFPPCTDMAVSGARWFADKWKADSAFFAKAVNVAEQCRTLAEMTGAPYLIENPVSTLSQVFGKASYSFNPWQYTALEPGDNYTKKTNLWTGGGFVMPAPQQLAGLDAPDNRIHMATPGPERANIRSVTPMGFARAVFASNAQLLTSGRTQ